MRLALWQLAGLCILIGPMAVQQATYHLGRKFLVGSSYVLPSDEDARLDAQHTLMSLLLGALYLAPIAAPRAVLDVACGTGRWCQEMAAAYPAARVVGLDANEGKIAALSLRSAHRRQASLEWLAADATEPLPFEDGSFDLVHLRFGATFLLKKQWPGVVQELARVTRPGGWVECVEGAMPSSPDPDYQYLAGVFARLITERGLDLEAGQHLAGYLTSVGLTPIETRSFQSGQTPEQQQLLRETTLAGFANLVPVLSRHLARPALAAYQDALAAAQARRPLVARTDIVVYAQKP